MSIFRFGGNIAEGMRESDERARGLRAKAIEAYDAFVRNNPEATEQELFGRREMAADGSNYLLAALPDDASIRKQIERNEAAAQVRKEAEEMTRLDQLQKRQAMISETLSQAVDRDLGDRYANPSKMGQSDQDLLASVRKILPEALHKDFDKNYPAGYSLGDLRSTRELARLQEAEKVIQMYGDLTPDQISKAGLPTNIMPFAIAVAERKQAEKARLQRDEARKDARLELAKERQKLDYDNEMHRRDQVELTRKIGLASEAEKQRLSRVKTARELTNQAQEQAASQLKLTGVSQASALAEDAGLDDDEKEIVTKNVQAIAEIYAVTETQIAEIAKIAVEQAETGSITSIKEAFEQKSGRLARRIDVVMQAGLGIETAPSVMTAQIDDQGTLQTNPGSYTEGVQLNIQTVAKELADIANSASRTPDAKIQQAYQLQANRIQAIRNALALPGYNVTSGFDPAVIDQLKDTVNSLEAQLINMRANVKGTPAPTAAATTTTAPQTAAAQTSAPGQTSTPVRSAGGGRTQAQFTVDPVAANAGVQRALAKYNANPNATHGSGQSKRKYTLRDRIREEFGMNEFRHRRQLDALERFATQPQAPGI
jgi:hypothetical protein